MPTGHVGHLHLGAVGEITDIGEDGRRRPLASSTRDGAPGQGEDQSAPGAVPRRGGGGVATGGLRSRIRTTPRRRGPSPTRGHAGRARVMRVALLWRQGRQQAGGGRGQSRSGGGTCGGRGRDGHCPPWTGPHRVHLVRQQPTRARTPEDPELPDVLEPEPEPEPPEQPRTSTEEPAGRRGGRGRRLRHGGRGGRRGRRRGLLRRRRGRRRVRRWPWQPCSALAIWVRPCCSSDCAVAEPLPPLKVLRIVGMSLSSGSKNPDEGSPHWFNVAEHGCGEPAGVIGHDAPTDPGQPVPEKPRDVGTGHARAPRRGSDPASCNWGRTARSAPWKRLLPFCRISSTEERLRSRVRPTVVTVPTSASRG